MESLPFRTVGRTRSWFTEMVQPLGVFVGVGSVVWLLAAWRAPGGIAESLQTVRVVAGDYLVTADVGYPPGTWRLATFPGFAMAIRLVRDLRLAPDLATASVLIAAVGGAATCVTCWAWMRWAGLDQRARRWGVLCMLVSPAGFVLVIAPQSEAVFLPAIIGACLAWERQRRWLAVGLLAVASATRLPAVLVVAALVVRQWELDGVLAMGRSEGPGRPRLVLRTDRLKASQFMPILGMAGAGAFFVYTWIWHGSPFRYFVEQEALITVGPRWHPATWVHWSLVIDLPEILGRPQYLLETAVNIGAIFVFAWSVPGVARRFGLGYGLLVVGHLAMVWFMAYDFASTSRYLLGAFPVFAIAAIHLEQRRRSVMALVAGSAAVCLWVGTMYPQGLVLA